MTTVAYIGGYGGELTTKFYNGKIRYVKYRPIVSETFDAVILMRDPVNMAEAKWILEAVKPRMSENCVILEKKRGIIPMFG